MAASEARGTKIGPVVTKIVSGKEAARVVCVADSLEAPMKGIFQAMAAHAAAEMGTAAVVALESSPEAYTEVAGGAAAGLRILDLHSRPRRDLRTMLRGETWAEGGQSTQQRSAALHTAIVGALSDLAGDLTGRDGPDVPLFVDGGSVLARECGDVALCNLVDALASTFRPVFVLAHRDVRGGKRTTGLLSEVSTTFLSAHPDARGDQVAVSVRHRRRSGGVVNHWERLELRLGTEGDGPGVWVRSVVTRAPGSSQAGRAARGAGAGAGPSTPAAEPASSDASPAVEESLRGVDPPSARPTDGLTFNLNLTNDQRRARENVPLPYMPSTDEGGPKVVIHNRAEQYVDDDLDDDLPF